jgi:hypothetical protein
MIFINLHNPSSRTIPWDLLSPSLPPREAFWYSFLLEVKATPMLILLLEG